LELWEVLVEEGDSVSRSIVSRGVFPDGVGDLGEEEEEEKLEEVGEEGGCGVSFQGVCGKLSA
jgi:hypothetical protein